MTIHVYHPYRQPDGVNYCQAVNGHCSHLCLPAPKINERSPRISCACPTGLKLMEDGLMCVEDDSFFVPIRPVHKVLEGRYGKRMTKGIGRVEDYIPPTTILHDEISLSLASTQYTRFLTKSSVIPFGHFTSYVTIGIRCVPSMPARSILGDEPQSVQYIHLIERPEKC
uniref:Uncharacterized protein n=1 Tax=Phlebotomus papatasi TaxID=29031 RepID=A0A1B0DFC8_PHLPP